MQAQGDAEANQAYALQPPQTLRCLRPNCVLDNQTLYTRMRFIKQRWGLSARAVSSSHIQSRWVQHLAKELNCLSANKLCDLRHPCECAFVLKLLRRQVLTLRCKVTGTTAAGSSLARPEPRHLLDLRRLRAGAELRRSGPVVSQASVSIWVASNAPIAAS